MEDFDDLDKIVKLKATLKIITTRIQEVRQAEINERKRLEKYEKASTTPKSYEYVKSVAKAYIYDCKLFTKKSLTINEKICYLMSSIQYNQPMMAARKVNVTNKENVSILNPTDVVKTMININKHPELIKQGSDEWKMLHHAANITGSTAYNALGCRGANSMRAHYDEFIYKKVHPHST